MFSFIMGVLCTLFVLVFIKCCVVAKDFDEKI